MISLPNQPLRLMRLRIVLALVSFAIYAIAAISLHQDRTSAWQIEFDGPFQAALSNKLLGAPIGTYYLNVYHYLRNLRGDPHEYENFEKLASRQTAMAPGVLMQWVQNGDGLGYVLFSTVSMRFFGQHISSAHYLFLSLVGISVIVFVWRFRDQRLLTIPLTFTALTLTLLTPLVTDGFISDQAPVGGLRYFSIAGIIPALHLLLEALDLGKRTDGTLLALPGRRQGALFLLQLFPMIIQVCLLTFTYIVRASDGGLLAAPILAAVFVIWTNRRKHEVLRRTLATLLICIFAGAAFTAISSQSVSSDYRERGQIVGSFWERAIVSFGVSPKWPYPKMRAEFDCTFKEQFKEGMLPGLSDNNPGCIWIAINRDQTDAMIVDGQFDPDYEATMRYATFRAIELDPREFLKIEFYYKPLFIASTLRDTLDVRSAGQHPTALAMAVLQLIVFCLFIVLGAIAFDGDLLWQQLISFAVLCILSLPQYFVAWADLKTGIDLIFFEFALPLFLLAAVVDMFARTLMQRTLSRERSANK
jgi:hypothetical protein